VRDWVTRLLGGLLWLSVLLGACQPPFTLVAGRQTDTFQSEALGVSFWTPAGWEVRTSEEQADSPPAVWLREPLNAQQRSQLGEALRLGVVQLTGYGSLAEAVEALAPPYRRAPECQVEEDVTLQGYPATRFTCPGERRRLVDVEGKLYDLSGQAPPRRQEELGPLWDAFLASVRFVASE